MNWHRYAPYILESSPVEGDYVRFRIYKHQIKDSQAFYYTLHGANGGVLQQLARCETAKACMDMAEELTW